MREPDHDRIALRREVHDLNQQLVGILVKLAPVDGHAASAVRSARMALFDAWTILCTPPEDDDDH
jgi:hypothetical protein